MVHFLHALTQAYIQLILLSTSCFLMLSTMFSAIVMLSLPKKQQKMMNQKKEHMRPGPGLRFVSVYMRTVRTQTGTKLTRLVPATETKSDRSEFISRPVSCKCKQRNVWRPIRTHAGLSSFRSHVNTPLVNPRSASSRGRFGLHTFLCLHLHETGLEMNSDRSDFVSVAGPRRVTFVPV